MVTKYKYELIFYDEYQDEEHLIKGITFGHNLTEALNNLCKYYGEDSICKVTLNWEDEMRVPVYEIEDKLNCKEEDQIDFDEYCNHCGGYTSNA